MRRNASLGWIGTLREAPIQSESASAEAMGVLVPMQVAVKRFDATLGFLEHAVNRATTWNWNKTEKRKDSYYANQS